ncbi:MAG: F0F1 ATP synthase subunit delta, partial [Halobacteriovoraceae bacterium]|nr:F0F1 ATP synthase subunit delta [Halobacteriovoraceae bacterium]
KSSSVFRDFIVFILQEKRMLFFSMILKEAKKLADDKKGVVHGEIEGIERSLSENVRKKLVGYLERHLKKKVIFNYSVNNKITSGYRVVVDDLQLDASVDKQLDIFEESLLEEEIS